MTRPAFPPTPPVPDSPPLLLYPCPHLPGKAQLTVRGCEANREFVRAILGGEKIRVNNHPVFKDKDMALGLKHVCRDCPGILEVNDMKSTESAAARKAMQQAQTPAPRKGGDTEKRRSGEPENRREEPRPAPITASPPPPVHAKLTEKLTVSGSPRSPIYGFPLSPVPDSPLPPPKADPDPVLNIRRCKNHPERPWHKNTGLCLECNQDRLKTSANSPTAKLPHQRKAHQILLDFEGREDLLQWLQNEAKEQFRSSPEAQLMFIVKMQWETWKLMAPPQIIDWGS